MKARVRWLLALWAVALGACPSGASVVAVDGARGRPTPSFAPDVPRADRTATAGEDVPLGVAPGDVGVPDVALEARDGTAAALRDKADATDVGVADTAGATAGLPDVANVVDAAADTSEATSYARTVLSPTGAQWRYLDTGADPGATWMTVGFDDAAWRVGPARLGYGGGEATVVRYGPDPTNRYVTTYFRRRFTVATPTRFRQAVLRLLRDDGAVVYLNGREVFRSNLPTGAPVTPTTLATETVSAAEASAFQEIMLDPRALVVGSNSLAVEVHQVASDSPGLAFDLEVEGYDDELWPDAVDPVLVGAGDIADCGSDDDLRTGRLLDRIPGTIFLAGDTVYNTGTDDEYSTCFDPVWGRHRARFRPAVGNHEYETPRATGYYRYFGAAAGDPARGYYSYNLGAWHVVVLNSNCDEVGGCDAGSPQDLWLTTDLAANPSRCTLAYWHHPRFTSGVHGSDARFVRFSQVLYDAGAELVLVGHDHDYERFAPQDALGRADEARGLREFVVGTGGVALRYFNAPAPNSEVRNVDTWGVLRMVLRPGGYDWRFVPVEGQTFTDGGSGVCH